MATKKTVTKTAVEETKATVKTEEKVAPKETVKKAEEAVKETTKKETTKKETTKKTTTKKAATTKKTTKKADIKRELFIQYNDNQLEETALLERVMADCESQNVVVKELKLYLKPQDNACYYVANGNFAGKVDLF